MQARDSTGRQVSLLNDDACLGPRPPCYMTTKAYRSTSKCSPLPPTPELLRSNSYDSSGSCDPVSPITPAIYDMSPTSHASFDDQLYHEQPPAKRPAYVDIRTQSYTDEDSSAGSSIQDRPGKRYPCRFRDTHGCEKTFTTSGHASRHSKIHTAEKAVHCSFAGCNKKFTRADNMKQHLDTHYKDKMTRPLATSKGLPKNSNSAASKRSSGSSKVLSAQKNNTSPGSTTHDVTMWDADCSAKVPSSCGAAWNMRDLNLPLIARPGTARTSSGLDALAAIACRESVRS